MRLLVVSNVYPPVVRGGYEVECRDVVEHLRRSHDVTVLASTLGAADAPDDARVLRRLPWIGDERKLDSVLALPHARRAVAVVSRTIAETAPDALYVWNAAGMPSATLRALQLSRVPLLVRVCEYWFGGVYRHDTLSRYLPGGAREARTAMRGPELAWAVASRALARSRFLGLDWTTPLPAAVCWNSEWVAEAARAPQGVTVAHRAIVIPSNARTEQLDGVPRRPEPGRVLFVGRLEPRKGAETLVRALALLRHPEAALHLVGPGSPHEIRTLELLAAEHGVGDRVRLHGPLRGPALNDQISRASAWCVPSVWDEPAPLTCTEAALARVPGVFSRVGGIPEMYAEGEHALFHQRADAEGCAAALAQVLAGGPEVDARVQRALVRGRELSFGPYITAMDRFLAEGYASLTDSAAPPLRRP